MPNPDQSPAAVLRAARELLNDPKRWTKGAYAADADGNILSDSMVRHADAVRWCALGALRMAGHGMACQAAACFLYWNIDGESVPEWNDAESTTHADVLAAFDRAIAAAESAAEKGGG